MTVFLPAFYFGICLSMTLILAALLSSAAMVRESQCLTAMVRIHTCRDWLGVAFCHLGLALLMCSAGVCVALCPGECTPGEGGPVVSPCAARRQFLKTITLQSSLGSGLHHSVPSFVCQGPVYAAFRGKVFICQATMVMTILRVFFFSSSSQHLVCVKKL